MWETLVAGKHKKNHKTHGLDTFVVYKAMLSFDPHIFQEAFVAKLEKKIFMKQYQIVRIPNCKKFAYN